MKYVRQRLIQLVIVILAVTMLTFTFLRLLMAKRPTAGVKELNVFVKADVYGSAEAIKESILK